MAEYIRRISVFDIVRGSISLSPEGMIEKLIDFGYIHSVHPGELWTYKREGSTISLTESITGNLYHIEWFDTEIESIIEIDQKTGKRSFKEGLTIKDPNSEKLERQEWVLNEELLELIWSAKWAETIVPILHPPSRGHTAWNHKNSDFELQIIIIWCDFLSYIEQLRTIARVHFSEFQRENSTSLDVAIPQISHVEELKEFLRERGANSICIYTKYEKTLRDFLEYNSLQDIAIIPISKVGLESFETHIKNDDQAILDSSFKLQPSTIITDDILGEIFVQNRTKKSVAKNLDLLLSLKPGDYVVHREHGIGMFYAVVKKKMGEMEREYLELHYANNDILFVPLTEIYRVSKYLWSLEPTLTSLAGKEWERTIEKADEEIAEIAREILETSAKRSLAKGRSFWVFREKETIFQSQFQYEYTRDQSMAIQDIFRDMEDSIPMDRLISWDVGFGKTEVAMNAIYKAVLSGTQVAVISPLLVLADEHYETFNERLWPFGIRIGILTRMSSEKEQKKTLADLKNGNIDVIVGTHRLLSDDIRFARLGLLVIDEEHKFWVSHKEKLKKLRAWLDILSLSATPIPRSLNLALSGLKKISILATPPKKKKPIETIITKWNESILAKAIAYELARGGQSIIVHNRIRGIESIEKEIEAIIEDSKDENRKMGVRGEGTVWKVMKANKLKSKASTEWVWLSPDGFGTFATNSTEIGIWENEPRIIITHGQMPGEQIEDRIHAFKKWEYDILLTTTIIENGVNFLSANTIIIIDPEEFWLAQLHQLRGRVGRKDAQGYCYLMYRKGELVKDEKERLITIANNTHLWAGFEIAMRDMEIRGAWDVLGFKQSGKSKDLGLTLYFRMLEEKIEELKDEKKKRVWTKIELDISYTIPDEYFLSESDKLSFYREIENIETLDELEEIEEELRVKNDAWRIEDTNKLGIRGESTVWTKIQHQNISNLFLLLKTRILLSEYGVIKLSKLGMNYVFDFAAWTDVARIKSFLERFDTKKVMVLVSLQKIRVEIRNWKSVEGFLEEISE